MNFLLDIQDRYLCNQSPRYHS